MRFRLGTMLMFWDLFRNTKFGDIDEEASFPVRIAVSGDDPELVAHVLGALSDREIVGSVTTNTTNANVVVKLFREHGAMMARVEPLANVPATTVMIADTESETILEALAPAIVDAMPDLELSAGRRIPALRAHAGQKMIRGASMDNAQLAVVTNIPEVIPVLGPFIGSAADLIFLTRNQVLLVYRLATLHGRPLSSKREIIAEIVPVLGAGFGWRAIARQVASFIPFGLGIIPKVAIAYVGTFSLGQAAHYYFTTGRKAPKEILTGFQRDAMKQLGALTPARFRKDDQPKQIAGQESARPAVGSPT